MGRWLRCSTSRSWRQLPSVRPSWWTRASATVSQSICARLRATSAFFSSTKPRQTGTPCTSSVQMRSVKPESTVPFSSNCSFGLARASSNHKPSRAARTLKHAATAGCTVVSLIPPAAAEPHSNRMQIACTMACSRSNSRSQSFLLSSSDRSSHGVSSGSTTPLPKNSDLHATSAKDTADMFFFFCFFCPLSPCCPCDSPDAAACCPCCFGVFVSAHRKGNTEALEGQEPGVAAAPAPNALAALVAPAGSTSAVSSSAFAARSSAAAFVSSAFVFASAATFAASAACAAVDSAAGSAVVPSVPASAVLVSSGSVSPILASPPRSGNTAAIATALVAKAAHKLPRMCQNYAALRGTGESCCCADSTSRRRLIALPASQPLFATLANKKQKQKNTCSRTNGHSPF
eukprot:m.414928 g.414928  ORF g.414928 m.414928 type:complete len:403 (+) comp20176_c5_seq3:905-2113(+)